MSEEGDYYLGEEYADDPEQSDCDYGFEFCEDPFLRSIGNCFECKCYQEACEAEEEEWEDHEVIRQQARNPT